MSTLNRAAYVRLVAEDLVWLRTQLRTLERDHIEAILRKEMACIWPYTPCQVCGVPTLDEGNYCSAKCLDHDENLKLTSV